MLCLSTVVKQNFNFLGAKQPFTYGVEEPSLLKLTVHLKSSNICEKCQLPTLPHQSAVRFINHKYAASSAKPWMFFFVLCSAQSALSLAS